MGATWRMESRWHMGAERRKRARWSMGAEWRTPARWYMGARQLMGAEGVQVQPGLGVRRDVGRWLGSGRWRVLLA
jgi:hypothetical protein